MQIQEPLKKGKEEQVPKEGSSERERNPEACPGNPGSIPERERSPQASQEKEKRLDALTEADPTVPGTAPEKKAHRDTCCSSNCK